MAEVLEVKTALLARREKEDDLIQGLVVFSFTSLPSELLVFFLKLAVKEHKK
jgi:hypothetical protein